MSKKEDKKLQRRREKFTLREWHEIYQEVDPLVVKIQTQGGHGTGYLCFQDDDFLGFATAFHVVAKARLWMETIIIHYSKNAAEEYQQQYVFPQDYIIDNDNQDSAIILVRRNLLGLSNIELPEFIPIKRRLKVGAEVGWIGFPAMASSSACFFCGNISAFHDYTYLIDGVAISGVSGGPVFNRPSEGEKVRIVGTISAYAAGYTEEGDSLPGLSVAIHAASLASRIPQIKKMFDEERKNTVQKDTT